MKAENGIIFQYIREGKPGRMVTDQHGVKYLQVSKGPKKGVVAATIVDGKIKMGISLLSPKEPRNVYEPKTVELPEGRGAVKVMARKYNRDWAKAVGRAVARAKHGEGIGRKSDFTVDIKEQIEEFEDRCHRYFNI